MKRNGVRPSVCLSQFARYSSEWRVCCCAWAGLGHPSLAAAAAGERELCHVQWRRQDFVTGGSEVWVYRGSRVRCPPVRVVLSVHQRDSLLDGLAMYLSCDTKKFHDNESTHILHNFWTSTHRGELPSPWRLHWPRCQRT